MWRTATRLDLVVRGLAGSFLPREQGNCRCLETTAAPPWSIEQHNSQNLHTVVVQYTPGAKLTAPRFEPLHPRRFFFVELSPHTDHCHPFFVSPFHACGSSAPVVFTRAAERTSTPCGEIFYEEDPSAQPLSRGGSVASWHRRITSDCSTPSDRYSRHPPWQDHIKLEPLPKEGRPAFVPEHTRWAEYAV